MSGRRIVLVLEDDPFISMDLEEIVSDVLTADVRVSASVAEARRVIEADVDLALLDIDVKDGKSFPIAAALLARMTPVIFVSGSKPVQVPPPLRSAPFVTKPYAQRDVEAVIRAGGLVAFPSALFCEPERVGEVMQGNHGGQLALDQSADHLAVGVDGVFVPAVGRGLHAAPLNGEAVGVLAGFGGAVKVFAPAAAPPVAGFARLVAVKDAPGFVFPGVPVVVGVAAFHLVSGGGAAPQKSFWKCKSGLWHELSLRLGMAALTGRTNLLYPMQQFQFEQGAHKRPGGQGDHEQGVLWQGGFFV